MKYQRHQDKEIKEEIDELIIQLYINHMNKL